MEVILAKSAGFCFGVRRAVNEVYRCLEEEKDTPIYTFGPIIHNDEVVNDLKNKGVQVVDTLESLAALKKGIVIIRSHGVGRDTETKMLYTMLMAMFVRSAVRMLLWSHCSGDTTTVVRWLLWKGRHIRKSFPGCA